MINKRKSRIKKEDLLFSIMNIFQDEQKKQFSAQQISNILGMTRQAYKSLVKSCLAELSMQGQLIEGTTGKYKLNKRGVFVEGRLKRSRDGKNYLYPDDEGTPIFVAERNTSNAMNGDRVRIMLLAKKIFSQQEGQVTEVLERSQTTFVGLLDVEKSFAFLITDSKKLANDIFIPGDKIKGGKTGQKAVVKITSWPKKAKNPIGEVIDILGVSGNNDTEMNAIMAEYGLPYKYPEDAEREADKIPDKIDRKEIKEREDLRNTTTFTIDPKDAKDFDDALSIKKIKDNLWEIGVHIADVTHYVKPGSIIDKEAIERGTSVYLVDRTVSMLPERLCNEICSLRPDEEKLCFSCIFEMDDNAKVKKSRICRTVIKSNKRFTYEEAQKIIDEKDGILKDELLKLNELAQILRGNRFSHGAINFETQETKFEIDENGKPLSVYVKESKEANKLIEEFMLLANRTVAETIGRNKKEKRAFVYRVHDLPDSSKMDDFASFIKKFGYKIKTSGSKTDVSKSFNSLMDEVKGKTEENIITSIGIRAMAKAVYTTKNIGHYGLAFNYYTHFTSPIRRYPDMMVHRLLERYLKGEKSVSENELEEKCKHCSDMELLAAKAERSSIKYKEVEYMSERIGNTYDGIISGITEWGVYVEIEENKCEGMIPLRDLDDDFYEFDEKNYCLTGRRRHRKYQLGDKLRIKVARAALDKKQLDFVIAKE